MNRRDFFTYSFGLTAMVGIAFCADYHKVRRDIISTEVVSSVLISADQTKIVVMTRQYHYIFDVPTPVVQALKAPFHTYVQATFSTFHVDAAGKTIGTVSLLISNAPNEALEAAISAGFAKTASGAAYATTLHGDRYGAGNLQPTQQYKLNKTYEITVVSEGYEWRPTPIATVEGEFALGSLILFSLPIALASKL